MLCIWDSLFIVGRVRNLKVILLTFTITMTAHEQIEQKMKYEGKPRNQLVWLEIFVFLIPIIVTNTLYYQYWKLLSKYIERFQTADATLSSSWDCSFNDKAFRLWGKCDFKKFIINSVQEISFWNFCTYIYYTSL